MGFSVFPQPSSGVTTSQVAEFSSAANRLTKRSTINSTTNNISIPSDVTFVYALAGGGGGGGGGSRNNQNSSQNPDIPGGMAGSISFGLTLKTSSATVGAGGGGGTGSTSANNGQGSTGGATTYGTVVAGGGGGGFQYANQSMDNSRRGIAGGGFVFPEAMPYTPFNSTNNRPNPLFSSNFFSGKGGNVQNPQTININTTTGNASVSSSFFSAGSNATSNRNDAGNNTTTTWNMVAGGGGGGYLGAGNAASGRTPGNGGSGGGGGGGAPTTSNITSYNLENGTISNSGGSDPRNGGNGGDGFVELYY
jgi:hypothetical protein